VGTCEARVHDLIIAIDREDIWTIDCPRRILEYLHFGSWKSIEEPFSGFMNHEILA
jgi:hypothetical protein